MLVAKELKDYLFLLMIIQQVIIVSVNSPKTYLLLRSTIKNYTIKIDERNVCDQPINDLIRQYDEVRKVSKGQGDGYTTSCLLDYKYFRDIYRLIPADLSKQKALDADSSTIQHIIFTGKIKATAANTRIMIDFILEQSKETTLQWFKGQQKYCNYV